jgi:hypothetical protein
MLQTALGMSFSRVFSHMRGHGGFKQVLISLLDKAAKFTPESGPIRVAVSMAGRSLEILIRDTRTGIPENRHSGEPYRGSLPTVQPERECSVTSASG